MEHLDGQAVGLHVKMYTETTTTTFPFGFFFDHMSEPGWPQDWMDSHTRMAFDELDGVNGWIFFRMGVRGH